MKTFKLTLLIAIIIVPILSKGQMAQYDFNYSFTGDYNSVQDNYSLNMKVDSAANASMFIDMEGKKVIITNNCDTIFNQVIYSANREDGLIIINTTNYFTEAVVMLGEGRNDVTLLYDWQDQTDMVRMHYKHKHYLAMK